MAFYVCCVAVFLFPAFAIIMIKKSTRLRYALKRKNIYLLLLIFLTLFVTLLGQSVYGASAHPSEIRWFDLVMGLFGGLALFLAGLDQLADGLKKVAGETLKVMLAKLTTNRVMGAVTGAVVTGILNSSSITTVLVVGFVTAQMMSLTQSVGVIMGANIGSTMTAQILAFNVSHYALVPVAIGFFMLFSSNKERVKHYGMMLMGLGLVFYGMGVMSEGMKPLRDYQPFLDILQKMSEPAFGILAGAVFTGLVQSSAATVGIAIAMASEGFLSLPAGISLALGANIGTCVTALMAALGKPTEAVRAAVVHIGFNIIGVLLWFFFIDDLSLFLQNGVQIGTTIIGPLFGAASVPRQIANANTIFNVVNTLIFLPFAPWFALAATRLVKQKEVIVEKIKPLYLDSTVLDVPSIALGQVRQELGRAGAIVIEMFEKLHTPITMTDMCSIQSLADEEESVDILEKEIVQYLSKLRQRSLSEAESEEHRQLMTSAITMETLADVIMDDLVRLSQKACRLNYKSSEETISLMRDLYLRVLYAVRQLVLVMRDKDMEAAARLLEEEPHIYQLQHDLIVRKSQRLGSAAENALNVARIEVSVADKLGRIYSLAKRITLEHKRTKNEPEEEAEQSA